MTPIPVLQKKSHWAHTGLPRGPGPGPGGTWENGDSLENYFSKVGLGDLGTSKGFATALESISPCGCHRTPCGRAILPQNHFPQAPFWPIWAQAILADLGPGHLGPSGPGPSWPIWARAILGHLGPDHLGPILARTIWVPDHLGPIWARTIWVPFGPRAIWAHWGPWGPVAFFSKTPVWCKKVAA